MEIMGVTTRPKVEDINVMNVGGGEVCLDRAGAPHPGSLMNFQSYISCGKFGSRGISQNHNPCHDVMTHTILDPTRVREISLITLS